ncbi:tyrosine-type recombinase/integrase [Pararhizobium sp.]|uniref:tyrosine-type recombinase/integrase n=1 Tax=Pararhizobium sp. TaxID=1977563 RepID=UPI00271ECF65|nr:integrase [Pararhizobium sp.]MDO9417976.1 integrase [Pararhizobium sp.]
MPRRRKKSEIPLPRHVQPVTSRGKLYYYFQIGRGTANAGPRVPLPRDPHSPEFWTAYQQLRGNSIAAGTDDTVNAVLDEWLMQMRAAGDVTASTIRFYEHAAGTARKAWGSLSPRGLKPMHVQAVFNGLSAKPGAANNFLSTMRSFSRWARLHEYIDTNLAEGIKPRKSEKGHKPWTPEQIAAAEKHLTGVVRRGVMLYLYTGMRGSDAVRVGPDTIDEEGFSLTTQKKGRGIYCPILPELEEEMKAWDMTTPGPFLKQEEGRALDRKFTRKRFSKVFAAQRDKIPELAGVTLHGLRCNAVIRLRRAGLEIGQIGDIVAMSLPTIVRYCRFADKKVSGKAALATLKNNEKILATVKHRKSAKQKSKENNKIGDER